jgi:hypothetical protein
MFTLYFRRVDGVLFAVNYQGLPHPSGFDPAQHFFFDADRQPNQRTERGVEATSAIRPATPDELAAFDAAQLDAEARNLVDLPLTRALIAYLRARLNEHRQAPNQGRPPLTPEEMRRDLIAEYKAAKGGPPS